MIESKQNNQFKRWLKLKNKKYRDQYGQFLVYGPHLIEVARKYDAIVEEITVLEDGPGIVISQALMNALQQTQTSYDVMAVCKKTNPKITSNHILMLDDVQDPDNVGALIRSAAAFGFHHVILSHQSADVYNEKVIRASQGAIFDVYIERKPLNEAIDTLKSLGYKLICADARGTHEVTTYDKMMLVMGNEGHGISELIRMRADTLIALPTQKVESLNVGVAGGILMYLWRQL
ncbi:MAG: TrmH family RNA methyltransferase [Acholeplasmataceae bacterium]